METSKGGKIRQYSSSLLTSITQDAAERTSVSSGSSQQSKLATSGQCYQSNLIISHQCHQSNLNNLVNITGLTSPHLANITGPTSSPLVNATDPTLPRLINVVGLMLPPSQHHFASSTGLCHSSLRIGTCSGAAAHPPAIALNHKATSSSIHHSMR